MVVMVWDLMHIQFSFLTGEWGKIGVAFCVDDNSSRLTDNKKKDIQILGDKPTDGLNVTTTTKEVKYSVNITKSRKKTCLSLYYNAGSKFLAASGVKFYQFKAKDSELKPYPLQLGNIPKDFALDSLTKT